MYAILAEDDSDVETLTVLIRRLSANQGVPVRGRGFGGSGDLLKHGARELGLYAKNATRFVVCHDCDREDSGERTQQIIKKIIKPSGVEGQFCALVPVKTIEAWLAADLGAIKKVLTGWEGAKPIGRPEDLDDPKRFIDRLTRKEGVRPRYIHAIHNPRIAVHIDLQRVRECCPSFEPLHKLVTKGIGNFPPAQ
jgi:hypothetical protein